MRGVDYVLDRLPLLLAFGAALGFLLLIVHLAIAPLNLADVAYLLLLTLFATSVILTIDYLRQRNFRRQVRERIGEPSAAPLQQPASREQRATVELLARTIASVSEEVALLREQADQHRSFVDLWVHNMKTPVSVIQLTAQQNGGPGWDSITEEAERLARGLDTMLATSRLERFDLDLQVRSTELLPLVRESVNELKSSWLLAGIYPVVIGTASSAETDPKWLKVVLRQLLVNALKYSAGASKVTVTVSDDSISVSDEGQGIPAGELPRVFDRFYTGGRDRARSASTGMGLYLAAQVCGRLGHSLRIDSEVDQGTTVTIGFNPAGLHRLGDSTVRFTAGK